MVKQIGFDDMVSKGCFVISLDFELMWGGVDCWTVNGYGYSHVAQVRETIKRMLELFAKYDVHVTFATVGFLMLNNIEEIQCHRPKEIPTYFNSTLNPYGVVMKAAKQHQHLYFAPDIVEVLKKVPNVEIGTHTFCHYYCRGKGQTIEQFDADMSVACKVAEEKGITLESIVFPRNQVSREYLSVCAKHGIKTYRGNPHKYFDESSNKLKSLYQKMSRFLDAYIDWGGNTSHNLVDIDTKELPINIPASRMLRPYMPKLRLLEKLRLRRIKKELRYAASHHELYHLWWHPHNFGANMEENLSFLENVLKCYQECHQRDSMESMTMKEFFNYINDNSIK